MLTQTNARSPSVQHAPAAREQVRAPGVGNAARQDRTGTGAGSFPEGNDPGRDPAYRAYERRLWERVADLMGEEDEAQRAVAARAMLAQAVRVQDSLEAGEQVDVDKLPKEPDDDVMAYPVVPFPPEWIGAARMLLGWANPPVQAQNPVEAMLHGADREGREAADYGVSNYQTQSNNLAAPEATCNGTSLAMVLERLGYSRDDLVKTISDHLKRKMLTQQYRREGLGADEVRKRVAEADLSCVYLPDSQWQARVQAYLQEENQRGSNYQRPRGATASGAEITRWSKDFKADAGIDDLALFLMNLLGIERTEVNSGDNPTRVMDAVASAKGGQRPTTERIDAGAGWKKTKPTVQQALEEGGAAMLSVFHKGRGDEGSHIVAIQSCNENGCVVDDPYGRMRANYTASKGGDAYTTPGKSRATSGLKNAVDTDRDDWKQGAEVSEDETRGMNSDWSDAMIADSWKYVVVFRRPRAEGGEARG